MDMVETGMASMGANMTMGGMEDMNMMKDMETMDNMNMMGNMGGMMDMMGMMVSDLLDLSLIPYFHCAMLKVVM